MQPNIVLQFILPSRIRWYNMNGSKYISPRVLFRGMKYDQGIGLSNESNVRIIYIYYTFLYIVYVYIYDTLMYSSYVIPFAYTTILEYETHRFQIFFYKIQSWIKHTLIIHGNTV